MNVESLEVGRGVGVVDGVELCHQQRVGYQVKGDKCQERLGQELTFLPLDVA